MPSDEAENSQGMYVTRFPSDHHKHRDTLAPVHTQTHVHAKINCGEITNKEEDVVPTTAGSIEEEAVTVKTRNNTIARSQALAGQETPNLEGGKRCRS